MPSVNVEVGAQMNSSSDTLQYKEICTLSASCNRAVIHNYLCVTSW